MMSYICVICTIKDPSLTPLSVEHRQIIEAVMSPIINTMELLNYDLLLCGYCKPLLQSVQAFQQTAVAGVKKLLSLHKQVNKDEDTIDIPIKEELEDPLLSPVKNEVAYAPVAEVTNDETIQVEVKVEEDRGSEETWSCDSDYGGPEDEPALTRTETVQKSNTLAIQRDETSEVYTHRNLSSSSRLTAGCAGSDQGQKGEEIQYFTSFAAAFRKPKVRYKPEPAECDICHQMLSCKRAVKLHKESKHFEPTILKCDVCGHACKGSKSLKYHKKSIHEDDNPKYCVECDIEYRTAETYRIHLMTKRHTGDSDYRFECNECGKKFVRRKDIINHLERHSGVQYPCDRCDQVLPTRDARRIHINRVHKAWVQRRNHVCHYCGKTFVSKACVSDHINTHTGARPHKCKICGDTFGYKSALYLHGRFKHKIQKKNDTNAQGTKIQKKNDTNAQGTKKNAAAKTKKKKTKDEQVKLLSKKKPD